MDGSFFISIFHNHTTQFLGNLHQTAFPWCSNQWEISLIAEINDFLWDFLNIWAHIKNRTATADFLQFLTEWKHPAVVFLADTGGKNQFPTHEK